MMLVIPSNSGVSGRSSGRGASEGFPATLSWPIARAWTSARAARRARVPGAPSVEEVVSVVKHKIENLTFSLHS